MYRKSKIPNFEALSKTIATVAHRQLVEQVDAYAEYALAAFRMRIEAQGFASFRVILYPESGTNLSPGWLDRKQAKGADLRTMIATGHYVQSLRVFRLSKKAGRERHWRVGFKVNERAKDLDGNRVDATLSEVAMWQEFGTSVIPARPHWRPQLTRMRRELPEIRRAMRKRVIDRIRAAVGRKMAGGR